MSAKDEMPQVGDTPPELTRGYNQTYIIRRRTAEDAKIDAKLSGDPADGGGGGGDRDVFFRCGNWCYSGSVYLGHDAITLRDMPRIIPLLQRQQGKLEYTCNAQRVPPGSFYSAPMRLMASATEFVAQEVSSDETVRDLARWAAVFPWIEDETQPTYFELGIDETPLALRGVAAMASKTYARGLVLISLYFEGSFYLMVKDGTGDQPLLDVRFPDVSQHGQGLSIAMHGPGAQRYAKLTLWQSLGQDIRPLMPTKRRASEVRDLSSDRYMQTYVIRRGADSTREAMFRFGSWCYAGRVELTDTLGLEDVPHVIPALRAQQSRLQFQCDAAQMPQDNPYCRPLGRMVRLTAAVEELVAEAEEVLSALLERMGAMGVDSMSSWLEGDAKDSFFEFTFAREGSMDAFDDVELVASKVYDPRGFVLVVILFGGSLFCVLSEGAREQPLLDSAFPDVSKKGRGYQVQTYPDGAAQWAELRKVEVWQTLDAMRADADSASAKADQLRAVAGELYADDALRAEAKRAHVVEVDLQRADGKYIDSPRAEPRDRAAGPGPAGGAADIAEEREEREAPEAGEGKGGGAARRAPPRKAAPSRARPAQAAAKAERAPGGSRVALPHHLPSNDGLSAKLEEIRRRMHGDGPAPWDKTGKPLRALGSLGAK